jgi:hypothetical protein
MDTNTFGLALVILFLMACIAIGPFVAIAIVLFLYVAIYAYKTRDIWLN